MTRPAPVFVALASPLCRGLRRREWLWLLVLLSYPLGPALAQAVGPPMRLTGAPTDRDPCPSTEFTAFFRAFSVRPELQRRYTKLPFEYGLLHMDRLEDEDEGFKKRMIARYEDIPQYRKKSGAIFPSAAELKANGLEIRITTQKNGQPRENTWPEEIITDPNHATATLILSEGGGLQVYYRFRRTTRCWLLFGLSDRST